MFGLSSVIDPTTYEPRSGKSALMNELRAAFAREAEFLAETIVGNCHQRAAHCLAVRFSRGFRAAAPSCETTRYRRDACARNCADHGHDRQGAAAVEMDNFPALVLLDRCIIRAAAPGTCSPPRDPLAEYFEPEHKSDANENVQHRGPG